MTSDFPTAADRREMVATTAERRTRRLAQADERHARVVALMAELDDGDRVRATFSHLPEPLVYEGRLERIDPHPGADTTADTDADGQTVLRFVEHPSAPAVAGVSGVGLIELDRIAPGQRVSVAYTVGLQINVDLTTDEVTAVHIVGDTIAPDTTGYSEDLDTYQPLSPIDPARDAAYAVAERAIWPSWTS